MATAGKAASERDAAGLSALITSRENRWLKDFRMALRGGLATASGCIGVEGAHLVEETLRSDLAVEAVLSSVSGERHLERLAALLGRADRASARILRTTDRLFAGIADTESPQGIAALVRVPAASFDDLIHPSSSGAAPFLAVLAGVQDPGNVGAILRTAEAFGATGAATCASGVSGTASPFSPKALRASAAAVLRMPILHGVGLPVLLAQLRVSGITIFAAVAHGPAAPASSSGPSRPPAPPVLSPWEANWRQPAAVLVGNEGAGLPEEVERSADARIRVPIAASAESLNVAIAAALIFYEASRQRSSGIPAAGRDAAGRGLP